MSDREIITPDTMRSIVQVAGYAPAVNIGETLYWVTRVLTDHLP